jgi:SAM-dependent methyltransferase
METNFFEHGSPYLQHPLLTPERTAEEVDFILSILPIEPGDKILDIGCGFGRHSLELAQRGFGVLGIDPSTTMIAAALERSTRAGNQPEFRQLRGEDLQVVEEFNAAICLFTTLGQVTDQKDNLPLLKKAYQSLLPGSYFILEVPQRGQAVASLKPEERFGEGENYTQIDRRYDADQNLVTEKFTLVSPAEQRVYVLQYRLFNRAEGNHLLEEAGFSGITFFDGYTDTPLDDHSPTMVIRAQKPG